MSRRPRSSPTLRPTPGEPHCLGIYYADGSPARPGDVRPDAEAFRRRLRALWVAGTRAGFARNAETRQPQTTAASRPASAPRTR